MRRHAEAPNRPWAPVRALASLFIALLVASATMAATERTPQDAIDVDCDRGDSLAEALATHGGDVTYRVGGSCDERITITADGVTIDGGGAAVLDGADEGPVIHVDGARRTAIVGLTVQNGQHGILVEHISSVTLDDVEARDNRSHGVEVINSDIVVTGLRAHGNGRVGLIVNRNSEVRLVDATLESNGISGLVVFSSAIARLEGSNVIRGNGDQGFTIGLGGMVFSIGAELVVEENGAEGIAMLQGGAAQFLGGSVTIQGNAGDGVALGLGSTLAFGMGDFQVEGQVLVQENAGHGVSVRDGSTLAIDAIMPLTSRANDGAGLHVDGASVSAAAAVFEVNGGPDVELAFGARLTTDDVTADDVVCDETALVRGVVRCP